MKTKKFIPITKDSTLNSEDTVRRKVNGNFEYYIVKNYDTIRERYILESVNQLELSLGIEIVTTTQELFDNFEKENHE
jgi:hypothetical protein